MRDEDRQGYCPGAPPTRLRRGLKCPLCGLFEPYGYLGEPNANADRSHEVLMAGRHWNRPDNPGSNPYTPSGLYGKAAEAAEGDWYGSH